MTEVPVRPAATVLLLRDGREGLDVFMVRRRGDMGFAADALVFPGGRLDAGDGVIAARGDLCRLPAGTDARAGAFFVAALRETFEESGILLARTRAGARVGGAELARLAPARAAIARGTHSFADFLAREDLVLAADDLVPFAHWITPPVYPRRYDTMFFLALCPVDQTPTHDGIESVESLWITPAAALTAANDGAARVEFATRRNLEKLGRSASAAAAMETAARARIVTVLPEIETTPSGPVAHLPAEAGYGGTVFDFGPAAAPGAAPARPNERRS